MDLRTISANKVLNLLPIECINTLIQLTRKKVYVLLERQTMRTHTSYIFISEVYATYKAAINSDTYKNDAINIVVQEYIIDSTLQTDYVYVLLNHSCYPQVVTNDVNEWYRQLQLMPNTYISMSSCMCTAEILEENTFEVCK